MNIYLGIILAALLVDYFLHALSRFLDMKNLSTNLPDEFIDHYSSEEYIRSQEYLRENTRFSYFTSSFDSSSIDNPERGVKGMVVINNWAGSSGGGIEDWFPISGLPRINIHATGDASSISGGFSGLFNDGSGNIAINPQGTWAFTDTIGQTPVFDTVAPRYDHVISLTTENFTNVSGSGGLSSGTSGDAVYYPIWNDVTSGSPWSGNLPRLSYEILVIGVTG